MNVFDIILNINQILFNKNNLKKENKKKYYPTSSVVINVLSTVKYFVEIIFQYNLLYMYIFHRYYTVITNVS